MAWKRYPTYRDSGVAWLGEVPEGWRVLTIKRLSVVKRGASPRPIDDPIYFDDDGQYAWVRIADVTASEKYLENTTQSLSELGCSLSVPLEPGEFFLSIAGSVGKPILTKIKCCIHDGFVYFPQYNQSKEFLYYIFASGQPYLGLGKLGTQLNLNTDTVGDIHVALPSIDEQNAIATFLDREMARIDALLAKKERLIGLLREKRAALISRAVTKGLDPSAPMKDSGIAWIGEVPAHWVVKKLRECGRMLGGVTPSMDDLSFWDGLIPWVTPKDMKKSVIEDSPIRVTEKALEQTSLKIIPANSVLLVVRGMILAKRVPIARTKAPTTINQDMKAIVPDPEIDPNFLALLLESANEAFEPIIEESGHGTKRLPTEFWRQLAFAFPDKDEQSAVASHLDKATAEIDTVIEKTSHGVSLLQEYRTALISAAVTGKIDVRGEAPA